MVLPQRTNNWRKQQLYTRTKFPARFAVKSSSVYRFAIVLQINKVRIFVRLKISTSGLCWSEKSLNIYTFESWICLLFITIIGRFWLYCKGNANKTASLSSVPTFPADSPQSKEWIPSFSFASCRKVNETHAVLNNAAFSLQHLSILKLNGLFC